MAERYISIRQIADNIYDHPLLQNVAFDRIVNYAIEFMRKFGMYKFFEEKVAEIEIRNHRGHLPCDYYNVIQVKEPKCNHVYVAATDNFFYSGSGAGVRTYRIQDDYIYTTKHDGIIEFAYNAIKVDSDGFPLLPDNSCYTTALELYIKKKVFTYLFDQGKIPMNVLQNTQQEYSVAIKLCQSEFNSLSYDEAESISRMINRLLPAYNMHASAFIDIADREHKKI